MTFKEIMLPVAGTSSFYARLYFNLAPAGKRPLIDHAHPAYEFGFFKNCHGIYTVSDKQYDIEPGDIFFFRSNEPHYVTQIDDEEDIISMGFQFFPDFFWSHSNELFDAKYMKVFSDRNPNFSNRLARGTPETERIRELLSMIEKEFLQGEQEYGLMVKIHLINILVLLLRQYDTSEIDGLAKDSRVSSNNMAMIQSTMKYIDAHINENLTLAQLAQVANMSPSYFSAVFKELNGFSAWDYIASKRIDKARILLLSSDVSISDVFAQCGFNTPANFNRTFKRIVGYSPSEYRKLTKLDG